MSEALIKSSVFRASYAERLDCFGARAPRNDGGKVSAALSPSLRAERSNPVATKISDRFIHAGRPKTRCLTPIDVGLPPTVPNYATQPRSRSAGWDCLAPVSLNGSHRFVCYYSAKMLT
jgi:hypothetical protein